jgi:RNA polymerase sigma-70 factor (ECF subfamily)
MDEPRSKPRLQLVPPSATAARDEAIVAGLQRGDRDAAVAAWQRFAPMVVRILRRTLGERDVDDVVQDVFLRIFDRIPTLRSPAALPAFVLTVTARVAQWEIRKRRLRRFVQLSPTGEPPDTASFEPDPTAAEALAAFYRVLDELKAEERTAFVLRFLEGLEVEEVAAALGVSLSTAKRRIAGALDRVKRRTGDHPALVAYLARSKRSMPHA